MSQRTVAIALSAALAAAAATAAPLQPPPPMPTHPAFTATGTTCEDVTWSQETIAKYPHIQQSCQTVTQRDGKYFVTFTGEVRRVADGGRKLVMDFKDGERVELNTPPDMTVTLDGKTTPVRQLRPGDMLTFYVPQDRFVAQLPQGTEVSVPVRISAPEPVRTALVPNATMKAAAPEMPKTASELPMLALLGVLLTAGGFTMTGLRYARRAQR